MWLSGFHYRQEKLSLGDAWGNRFNVILRDIGDEVTDEELSNRIEKWKNSGFLNYFGHQRFGSCGVSSAEVGRLILAAKWEEAVNLLLKPREDAHGILADCLKEFHETNDPDKALRKLARNQRLVLLEGIILGALKKSRNAYRAAILALPRDMRSLYVHAYQSLVFNKVLSRRIEKYSLVVLEGDFDVTGKKINSLANVQISEVALPLPSSRQKLPVNEEIKLWYNEILREDGVNPSSFTSLSEQFAIGDVSRPIVVRPFNVEWTIIHYEDPKAVLQTSPFISADISKEDTEDKINEEDIEGQGVALECNKSICSGDSRSADKTSVEPKKFRALKLSFDLPSSTYATIALREITKTSFEQLLIGSERIMIFVKIPLVCYSIFIVIEILVTLATLFKH